MNPLPKVSASKYDCAPAAKVVFRVKDSGTEGITYQGQTVIKKCRNCNQPSPTK